MMVSRKTTAIAIISLVFACVLFTSQLRLDRYMIMDYSPLRIAVDPAPAGTIDPNKEEVEKCIFILSSMGSGSSTMVNLLQHCEPGCMISGENYGALKNLDRFYQDVNRTDKQPRPNLHEEEAWKKYFNLEDVEESMNNLVKTMLNPDGGQCWGFKEIRYGFGREWQTQELSSDIKFLSSLCQNPKIIFHTRRKPEDEFNSHVIRNQPEHWNRQRLQHQDFDSYVAKDKTSGEPPKVFRHYLEDYLERNTRFKELWEDYLECSSDVPDDTIEIVNKKQKKKSNNPDNIKGRY